MEYLEIDNKQEIDTFIEKIKFIGPDGDTIIFTNANSWYIDTLVNNLITSYKKLNTNRKIGVFCSDDDAFQKSLSLGFDSCMIKCQNMKISNSLSNVTPEEYRRLSFTKILIIDYLISKNYIVLYIDPDMSFNYIKYPNTDIINEILLRKNTINYLFDTDNSINSINNYNIKIDTVMAGYIHKNKNTLIYLNSNLMLILPTNFNKFLFKIDKDIFEYICQNIHDGGDETYINRVNRQSKYFSFWNEMYFPNGLNCLKYKDNAYMFHANCVSGLENKINLLKNCDGWFLN